MMEDMINNVERYMDAKLSHDDRRKAEELIKKGFDSKSVVGQLRPSECFYK